jgi:hypothetical protein
MTTETEITARNRDYHKQRRFAMKIQQKLDRALESFVRVNATKWHPELDETERKKINAEVKAIIEALRKGQKTTLPETVELLIARAVATSDKARVSADEMRKENELKMEHLAQQLQVWPWVESVHGAGALGLATIVAEAGDISNYPNVAKLWKRLGFAPFDGHAGSTWKRETWRPRKLTADEWTEHPFSGERYALIHQIAVWLVNTQLVGKKKTASGESEAKGPYGEVYVMRRKHTLTTRPEWSDGHRHMDAIRVAMKAFLRDLHIEWHRSAAVVAMPATKKSRKRAA